jgi:hypothetical protein
MTTSGVANFDLEFTEIAEEAWERAGREMRSGYDLRTARRSMNLMMVEWANRGINLFTIEQGEIPLNQGQSTYPLPLDTIDVIEHVVRTGTAQNQQDLSISRISVSTYATIPNKQTQGRPIQVWVQRLTGQTYPLTSGYEPGETVHPKMTVWPVPNQDNFYTLVYWRLRRIQNAGAGSETPDMSFRFLPALTAGLAYHIAMKVPELVDRIPMLKAAYDEQFDLAAAEDREKASVRFVPRMFRPGS